jgi:hypothetical protein
MEQNQASATRVRDPIREQSLRRDINDLLLKNLNGGTTLAEMEMIFDRVYSVIEAWNYPPEHFPPKGFNRPVDH